MRFEGGNLVSVLMINENFIHTNYGYCYYSFGATPLIYNLYIESQYRRQGRARYLLSLVIAEIHKSLPEDDIYIEVSPIENSISVDDLTKFYKSMGLHILKEVEK